MRVIDRLRRAHPGTWKYEARSEYSVWIHVESGREVAPHARWVGEDNYDYEPDYRWLDTKEIALVGVL